MVNASDGVQIDLDDLDKSLVYSAGVLQYMQVTYRGSTYRQTYTYTGSDLTGISKWVKQ